MTRSGTRFIVSRHPRASYTQGSQFDLGNIGLGGSTLSIGLPARSSSTAHQEENLLSPYRVLDLTDQGGLLCGKILADLGADVIQLEPPSGSAERKRTSRSWVLAARE